MLSEINKPDKICVFQFWISCPIFVEALGKYSQRYHHDSRANFLMGAKLVFQDPEMLCDDAQKSSVYGIYYYAKLRKCRVIYYDTFISAGKFQPWG